MVQGAVLNSMVIPKLCAIGSTGHGLVRNPYYNARVSECMDKMWSWLEGCCAERRVQHLNWTRHVFRVLNEEANDLATRGKSMDKLDCHFEIKDTAFRDMNFWRGAWDGGYDPGKVTCGVGFVLQGCWARPVKNQKWTNIVVGYGKCLR